ncbi:recombinase family protein [Crystallibacter degradans]|uniref:recombinase family protein n=1 Tax=Crystallibacter degradans TaxID=2726743 RepID=UPI0014746CE6|nr:recombinase family protein [Arthrobacter sp. SF27]
MKLGYARTSRTDQDASMQVDALIQAGVAADKIFIDELSGAKEAKDRPGMQELLQYVRSDDDVYFWRLDRIGRSVVDVLNTVNELVERGVRLHSIMDSVDPTSPQGRMQLAMMATLAEYERELINERVRAGVIAAQKRGVRFGPSPLDEAIAKERVATARRMMAAGKPANLAAKTVGWSKSTMYRYLKTYGNEPMEEDAPVRPGKDGSKYAARRRSMPPREQ